MYTKEQSPAFHQLKSLFDLLYLRLCHFADQLISDSAIAEDIVQEVFIQYTRQKQTITDYPAIKTLLYTMVKSACRQQGQHTETAMQKAEVWGEIYGGIAALPENCQQVFRLGFIEGEQNDTIASRLNISMEVVMLQKSRALELLRLKLTSETFLALYLVCL
ncbi:sigma factor [Chitinophaga eiseniae]|uniref:RNA polymerase sigma-70 factor, ECF subfamily n=1 Tax=Chitinophaga eiseniae TaxID=634771 RepID=A0A847SJ82_9BACT|nr:sigma factor [Chitinophaga eiseniae]NLR79135.1 hypothetical protein [Chitinophaga eiseniae]